MNKPPVRIKQEKRNEVEEIKRYLKEYKVMGIVNLSSLPAFNYMKIRFSLKDKIKLKYTKKRLMKIAFDEVNDAQLKSLKERLIGIPALIFTNEDPFRLAQILKKSKSNILAKPGDIAPTDIVVPAGQTEFSPGPMIGELGAMGIKTQVENGKVSIKADKLLVKTGEAINDKNAALMAKLKMEPMQIGLNLVLTYQNGEVLEGNVLNIDVDEYEDNLKIAAGESMALAMYIGYVTRETANLLIAKAYREGESLAEKSKFNEKISELNAQEDKIETIQTEHNAGEREAKTESVNKDDNEFAEKENEVKKEAFEAKINEIKGISDVTLDDIKKAQDILKDLTNKKIRGEI